MNPLTMAKRAGRPFVYLVRPTFEALRTENKARVDQCKEVLNGNFQCLLQVLWSQECGRTDIVGCFVPPSSGWPRPREACALRGWRKKHLLLQVLRGEKQQSTVSNRSILSAPPKWSGEG
jgi:hypothetical protein